jgi:hypothetical protein
MKGYLSPPPPNVGKSTKAQFKTSYLNEEVSCTEPSISVSVPWLQASKVVFILALFL